MTALQRIGGSFRDPSGFTFLANGDVYRQVNSSYKRHYDWLMSSGLYTALDAGQLLVSHVETAHQPGQGTDTYKVLRPTQIPFISYPYEWCFGQLKDAALLTLEVQALALKHDMVLKDASAYNIQFFRGRPILIDTLSFEIYEDGNSWIAYRQFCQHFLAPLALMAYRDVRLGQLLRAYLDGLPLDLAQSLLPKRTYLKLGMILHLHWHVRSLRRYADASKASAQGVRTRLGKADLLRICDSLRSTIRGLKWNHESTSWAGYYAGDSYEESGFEHKRQLVVQYLEIAKPRCVWDVGANTGVFSRIASQRGIYTVSIDDDPGVVESNYALSKEEQDDQLHPLLVDLNNPSAALGWANAERAGLAERGNADCVFALALVHHIAISNNVPLASIASYFASLGEWLIIEFVPKSDGKVQQLLASRADIFEEYTQSGFEQAFGREFDIVAFQKINNSERILYLMRRRGQAGQ